MDPLMQQRLAQLSSRLPASAPQAPKPGRRNKPARGAKLSALALSAVTTAGLAAVFAHQADETNAAGLSTVVTTPIATTGATIAPAATTAATIAPAATTAATTPATTTVVVAAPAGVLDGTYVGASDSNRWGTVQVQVVYSGGVIADVQIIQYPDGERKSVQINQRALPSLISEAVSAQSADGITVSGATSTSKSYRISLQSAIDAAKAASGIAG
jgi:uncharacterized protein with FMN-binding domain